MDYLRAILIDIQANIRVFYGVREPCPYENGPAHPSTPRRIRQFLNDSCRKVRPKRRPSPLDLQLISHMGQVDVYCLRNLHKWEDGDRGTWSMPT